MTLQQFLNQNTVDKISKEVIISDRFKDENGELFKFKIKPMNQATFEDIKKKASFGGVGGEINDDTLNCFIVIESTIYPSFKDSESLASLGCSSPKQYLNKVLLAGEIAYLADEIISLSGFDRGIEDFIADAKN